MPSCNVEHSALFCDQLVLKASRFQLSHPLASAGYTEGRLACQPSLSSDITWDETWRPQLRSVDLEEVVLRTNMSGGPGHKLQGKWLALLGLLGTSNGTPYRQGMASQDPPVLLDHRT